MISYRQVYDTAVFAGQALSISSLGEIVNDAPFTVLMSNSSEIIFESIKYYTYLFSVYKYFKIEKNLKIFIYKL